MDGWMDGIDQRWLNLNEFTWTSDDWTSEYTILKTTQRCAMLCPNSPLLKRTKAMITAISSGLSCRLTYRWQTVTYGQIKSPRAVFHSGSMFKIWYRLNKCTKRLSACDSGKQDTTCILIVKFMPAYTVLTAKHRKLHQFDWLNWVPTDCQYSCIVP